MNLEPSRHVANNKSQCWNPLSTSRPHTQHVRMYIYLDEQSSMSFDVHLCVIWQTLTAGDLCYYSHYA